MTRLNIGSQSQIKDIQDRLAAIEEKLGIVRETEETAEEVTEEAAKAASKKKAPTAKAEA